MFRVSKRTVYRAFGLEHNIILETRYICSIIELIICRYASKKKRCRITEIQKTEIIHFLNIQAPVISGRNYRILPCDIISLYEDYRRLAIKLVGNSYFRQLLARENIRKQTVASLCPYCLGNMPQSRKGSGTIRCIVLYRLFIYIGRTLELHKEVFKEQLRYYRKSKEDLLQNRRHCLLVYDFTQIQLHSQNLQDFIITIYEARDSNVCIFIKSRLIYFSVDNWLILSLYFESSK